MVFLPNKNVLQMRIHTCLGRETWLQILTLPTLSIIFTFSSASMHQNKVLLVLQRVKNRSQKFVWRAPYIYEYPLHKRGGILCLSLGVGHKVCLLVSFKIPLTLKVKRRHKNSPTPMPCDLHMFKSRVWPMDADVTKVKPRVMREPSAAQARVAHVFHYLTHLNKWFFLFSSIL